MSSVLSFFLGYVLNALWQMPLVVGAAWLAARMVGGRSAAVEHRIWVAALMLSVALPACAFSITAATGETWHGLSRLFGATARIGVVTVATGPVTTVAARGPHLSKAMLTGIFLVYALTLTILSARLLWGIAKTMHLRRKAAPLTLRGAAAENWRHCARKFGVANAEIAGSAEIFGPVTIGISRRTLLLPAEWGAGDLNPDDLNAAFAHEFAHMRRRDFAKNLAYEFLALPVAWHPAMLLLRARIAESREMLCDSLAADALDGRESYARSLLRLASTLARGTPAKTLHAIGIFDTNLFERRVMQLTECSMEMRGVRRVAVSAGCFALAFGVCASAFGLRMEAPRVSAEPQIPSTAPAIPAEPAVRVVKFQPAASAPEAAPAITAVRFTAPAPQPAPAPRSVAPEAAPAAAQDTPVARTTPAQVPATVIQGNLVWKKDPVYPPIAKASGASGVVVLHAIIGKDGSIKSLAAISGPDMLKGAALEAVKDWKYKPYLLNGDPTEVDTMITVTFALQS